MVVYKQANFINNIKNLIQKINEILMKFIKNVKISPNFFPENIQKYIRYEDYFDILQSEKSNQMRKTTIRGFE